MQRFTLSGDFSYDTRDMQSMDGFSLLLRIDTSEMDREQHVYIKDKLQEAFGLKSYNVPESWGDNPPNYGELNFETKDPRLCKHMIGLLKQGGVELKAAGRRYPSDSDHPLFATLDAPDSLSPLLKDFSSLNTFIEKTLSEALTPQPKHKGVHPRPS